MTEIQARYFQKDEDGKVIGDALEASCTYNFGETIQEAIDMFGSDVVHDIFCSGAKVKAQAVVRSALANGVDPQEQLNNWKPGVTTRTAKDPVSVVQKQLSNLTDEQKQAILQMLG